jgi:hypothetical protein
VQVDPIKPTLNAPETKRLKLDYDEPLSNFAFKCNLRRYTMAPRNSTGAPPGSSSPGRAATGDAAGREARPSLGPRISKGGSAMSQRLSQPKM